jgi:hypothetical protein
MTTEQGSTVVQEGLKAVVVDPAGAVKPEGNEAQPAAAAAPVVVQPAAEVDAEAAELARLEAAVKAEEDARNKGVQPGETKPAAAAAAPGAKPDATQTNDLPAAKPHGDPKDRAIIALRREAHDNRRRADQLEGENRALRGVFTATLTPEQQERLTAEPPPPKTAEEEIAEVDAQILQLAQDYDDSKISTVEWKKQELVLNARKNDITRSAEPVVTQDDTTLQVHVVKLQDTYPILNVLSVEQLKPFEQQAYAQAQAEGKPIQPNNIGTIELRERMARLAQAHYDKVLKRETAQPGNTGNGGAPAKPQLSASAQAREAKLELAGNHPPDIAALGAGAPGGEISEAELLRQITALGGDDDAIDRLIKANQQFASKVMRGVV